MSRLQLAILFLSWPFLSQAAPGTITPHIKIDQFGYYANSRKVAVIVDPQSGYNAADAFSPGTGANNYQVRRWSDDAVIFSGTLASWNGGGTHGQSGDRGWWFDFSSVTAAGSYYIYDVARAVGSYRFEIGATVYGEVLKHAVRMFYYQRINFAKVAPYADNRWTDGAAFEGVNQDRFARSRYAKGDASTAKDLHGGWMDAGDYNKYTTFTFAPLCGLLETYRLYPTVFTDNFNIPESGNGIPDLLDEIKWELDWLKRMQDASGTNGFYLKVGADNYNAASPPSADANPRYYLGECTSATLTGTAVFALASITYRTAGMTAYADDLLARAQAAWTRAATATSNFTSFQLACDDGDIKAGDADASAAEQMDRAITAAAYLYEATGNAAYKTAFDNMYTAAQPYAFWWWGPYYTAVQRALLRYARLPGATPAVSALILDMKSNQDGVLSISNYNAATDLYRSYMPDAQYHWGSNEVKAYAGIHNWDHVSFSINTANHALYKEVAAAYLHWFHGVNPMGRVMLTNMYTAGGDLCANEMYHSWFANGTSFDNAITSINGPAPGYVHGGPDKDYGVSGVTPPYGQPPQKSYKDWNTTWNGSFDETSWRITEPSIYAQAAYISLLARVMGDQPPIVLPLQFNSFSAFRQLAGIDLQFHITTDEVIRTFEVERSMDGIRFSNLHMVQPNSTSIYHTSDHSATAKSNTVYYRIKAIHESGSSSYSPVLKVPLQHRSDLTVHPNPVRDQLTLHGHQANSGMLQWALYDMNGKQVQGAQWSQGAGYFARSFSLAGQPAGVYLLRISGSLQKDFKIVRE